MVNNKHEVSKSRSHAFSIFNGTTVMMPKGNHQAVNEAVLRKLPETIISGVSRFDSMIEIIELRRSIHPFCVATQGHPEVDETLSLPLFRKLGDEMKAFVRTKERRAAEQQRYSESPVSEAIATA